MDSIKRVSLVITIAIIVGILLTFCAPGVPSGTVIGKGHDFENGSWYLILSPDCQNQKDCESVAVKVTEAEYNSYDTGEYYGDR